MAVLLSTTGTLSPVVIDDMGARSFTHPTTNIDLELEYDLWEILESEDLLAALTAGHITLEFNGIDLSPFQFSQLARGNMQTTLDSTTEGDWIYDADGNEKVDEADVATTSTTATTATDSDNLGGQTPAYYLNRVNHTGTQLASTISDFTAAARLTLSVAPDSVNYMQYNNVSGEFSVTPLTITDVTVDTVETSMANWITNVYQLDTTQWQEGDIVILANATDGSESWIHNGGSAGDINDWTKLNNNVNDSQIRAALSGQAPIDYNQVSGVIGITQAGTNGDGYLSAADYTTFLNKQDALTAGIGINSTDFASGTVNLDLTAYTDPGAINISTAAATDLTLVSDQLIKLDTPQVDIIPTDSTEDAKLRLEGGTSGNGSAIDFHKGGVATPEATIELDQNADELNISAMSADVNVASTGNDVNIAGGGIVTIQNIEYPKSTAGNNGDVLVYDGTGQLTFQSFGGGLTGGDGIDITGSVVSVDLAANSALSFNAGALTVDSSIAGTGLTWTTGVLSVDAIDLTSTTAPGVTGILPPENGGVGIDVSSAGNGEILIGTGSGLALGTISHSGGTLVSTPGSGTLNIDVAANGIDSTHIDFGTNGNQVNSSDIPLGDSGTNFTGTTVDDALEELSDALDNAAFQLNDLTDVTLTGTSTDQLLQYNGAQWVNIDISAIGIEAEDVSFTGTNGISSTNVQDAIAEVADNLNNATYELNDLTDVTLTGEVANQMLQYNGAQWVNIDISNLGIDAADVSFSGTSGISATDVEGALDELKNDLDTINSNVPSTTDDLPEGGTNFYYTEARVSANTDVAANTAKVSADGSIDTHSDVDTSTTAPVVDDLLQWDGSNWVPTDPKSIGIKRSWTITAGRSNNNVTNRYLDWVAGAHNISPYVVPINATIKYITVATRVNETWTAEVRNAAGTPIATLSISAATTGVSTELSVDVTAGDTLTFYCNGSNINRPSMSVLFDER